MRAGEAVLAVDADRALPRQVVETHVIERDAARLHPEHPRELPLEADRHVAQAARAVALVQQRLGDETRRVREIDEPGPRRADLRGQLGQLEHDRHRPQRLREPARAGGLLSDAVEAERDRLVAEARLVPADAQLHDDEVRPLERLARLLGQTDGARPARPANHPLREAADDPEPVHIDVQQHQLVDRQAVAAGHEPLDQLRRVRAAAADDRDLHTHPRRIVHSGR